MMQSMGLIHGKDIKDFTDVNMIEHNFKVTTTLLLTILQSVYGLVYALDKELGLEKFEKSYYNSLEEFITEGKQLIV